MKRLDKKVALVLGAIKGIGMNIGLALAKEGVKTALTYFDWEENLDQMKSNFKQTGTEHFITKIDLLDTDKIPNLIQSVIKKFGRLDILINNIERGGWPIVHGPYTSEQWDLELATTLKTKQWIFQSALPYLKKSQDSVVINFSSIAGIIGRSGPASYLFNEGYSAASRGTSLLTETFAKLGAPEVRANEIMLGIIETRHGQGTRGWGILNDQQKQAITDHTLLKRTGTIDDVVKTVLFIIKNANFMTGSTIRLDGGYVLGGDIVADMPKGVL